MRMPHAYYYVVCVLHICMELKPFNLVEGVATTNKPSLARPYCVFYYHVHNNTHNKRLDNYLLKSFPSLVIC